MHEATPTPSAWLTRWAPLVAAGGTVLDLACGSGRHLRWLAAQGFRVTGVDRDAAAVEALRPLAEIVVADLEDGSPWPLAERRFDGIVVTHYLWRPLLPRIAQALESGGVLVYETFAEGQQRYGRPSKPQFLLQPGELLSAFAGLRTVAYEDGLEAEPERRVQRLVAVAPPRIGDFEARRLLPPRAVTPLGTAQT
ncbi:MAG: class I SAM-dependent methyltransferase [Rubrivivax sp.]|nr:class I SAM-dependent methyltransferase [Rubrivivax sp.]